MQLIYGLRSGTGEMNLPQTGGFEVLQPLIDEAMRDIPTRGASISIQFNSNRFPALRLGARVVRPYGRVRSVGLQS